jgi:hypothetical protein
MRDLEAKDFLVQQAAEQAALENVALSDLEKRMMYFTENGEMRENAIELNDAFEAQHNTEEYEAKISSLLHHAYKRLKKHDPPKSKMWNDAIRALRKGDHYILVLWGPSAPGQGPSSLSLRMWAGFLLIGTLAIGARFFFAYLTKVSSPLANPWILLAILLGLIAASFLFPRQIERAGGWILDKLLFRSVELKSKEENRS